MPSRAVLVAAAVLSLAVFAWVLVNPIGIGYLDPVHRVEAQDEAVYSHAAIRMAERGEWSTPHFLGRFFLYKPPLVYWLPAASVKLFGVTRTTLRLPSALAAALCSWILFAWVLRNGSLWTALLAQALLIATAGFGNLAVRNMTDGLLTLFISLAALILSRDSALARPLSQAIFCATTAAAILLKSTAGLIPLLILAGVFLAARERPPLLRALWIGAVSVTLAMPWFAYQYSLHPRWFWSEFIEVELLAYGAGAPQQQAPESVWRFYGSVLWTQPVLLFLSAAAIPRWFRALRQRDTPAVVLAVWIGVMAAAILSFQYRNATYLLPLLPALGIVAGYLPRPALALGLAASLGLLFEPRPVAPDLSATLRDLCESGRPRELVIAGAIDSFHATVLPFHRVRYAFAGGGQPPKGFALDFERMGIVMPAGEFLEIEKHRPRYAAELRAWGLADDEALATVIAFDGAAGLRRLIGASPDRDFLVGSEFAAAIAVTPAHDREVHRGHVLLRSKILAPARTPARSCRL